MPTKKTTKGKKSNKTPEANISEFNYNRNPIYNRINKSNKPLFKKHITPRKYYRGVPGIHPYECFFDKSVYRFSNTQLFNPLTQETFDKYGLKEIFSRNLNTEYRKAKIHFGDYGIVISKLGRDDK